MVKEAMVALVQEVLEVEEEVLGEEELLLPKLPLVGLAATLTSKVPLMVIAWVVVEGKVELEELVLLGLMGIAENMEAAGAEVPKAHRAALFMEDMAVALCTVQAVAVAEE